MNEPNHHRSSTPIRRTTTNAVLFPGTPPLTKPEMSMSHSMDEIHNYEEIFSRLHGSSLEREGLTMTATQQDPTPTISSQSYSCCYHRQSPQTSGGSLQQHITTTQGGVNSTTATPKVSIEREEKIGVQRNQQLISMMAPCHSVATEDQNETGNMSISSQQEARSTYEIPLKIPRKAITPSIPPLGTTLRESDHFAKSMEDRCHSTSLFRRGATPVENPISPSTFSVSDVRKSSKEVSPNIGASSGVPSGKPPSPAIWNVTSPTMTTVIMARSYTSPPPSQINAARMCSSPPTMSREHTPALVPPSASTSKRNYEEQCIAEMRHQTTSFSQLLQQLDFLVREFQLTHRCSSSFAHEAGNTSTHKVKSHGPINGALKHINEMQKFLQQWSTSAAAVPCQGIYQQQQTPAPLPVSAISQKLKELQSILGAEVHGENCSKDEEANVVSSSSKNKIVILCQISSETYHRWVSRKKQLWKQFSVHQRKFLLLLLLTIFFLFTGKMKRL